MVPGGSRTPSPRDPGQSPRLTHSSVVGEIQDRLSAHYPVLPPQNS